MNTIAGGTVLITNANSYYDNLIDEIPTNQKIDLYFYWKVIGRNLFHQKIAKIFLINHYKIGNELKSLKFKGLLQIYYLHRKMFKKVSKNNILS